MKKVLALLLMAALVCSLAGCGDGGDAPDQPSAGVSAGGDRQEDDPPEAQEAAEAGEEAPQEPAAAPSAAANIVETVIFDANDITVTAKAMAYDGWMGPELVLLIENNSAQNITVQARNASVNGVMMDPTFSADVAAGKKANDGMSFMSSDLELAGVTTIRDIEFSLHIFDTETWDDIVDSDVIALSTDATDYVQAYDDSGDVVYDADGVRIVVQALDSTDSFWGADLCLYIENGSERSITVQAQDVSVNGFMIDPVFSCDVVQGKKAFDSIAFMESDLTDNGIAEITEIELRFHIFDAASWDTVADSDVITITFP